MILNDRVGFDTDKTFIKDTIKQLNCGQTCYAYKKEIVEEIKNMLKEKYNKDLSVEFKNFYYKLEARKWNEMN